jgi:hypothetical protein
VFLEGGYDRLTSGLAVLLPVVTERSTYVNRNWYVFHSQVRRVCFPTAMFPFPNCAHANSAAFSQPGSVQFSSGRLRSAQVSSPYYAHGVVKTYPTRNF